jgi:hypothetical protein
MRFSTSTYFEARKMNEFDAAAASVTDEQIAAMWADVEANDKVMAECGLPTQEQLITGEYNPAAAELSGLLAWQAKPHAERIATLIDFYQNKAEVEESFFDQFDPDLAPF